MPVKRDNSKGISRKIPDEEIIAFLEATWARIKADPTYTDDDNMLYGKDRWIGFETDEQGVWQIYYQQQDHGRSFDMIPYLKRTTFYAGLKNVIIDGFHVSFRVD